MEALVGILIVLIIGIAAGASLTMMVLTLLVGKRAKQTIAAKS